MEIRKVDEKLYILDIDGNCIYLEKDDITYLIEILQEALEKCIENG